MFLFDRTPLTGTYYISSCRRAMYFEQKQAPRFPLPVQPLSVLFSLHGMLRQRQQCQAFFCIRYYWTDRQAAYFEFTIRLCCFQCSIMHRRSHSMPLALALSSPINRDANPRTIFSHIRRLAFASSKSSSSCVF